MNKKFHIDNNDLVYTCTSEKCLERLHKAPREELMAALYSIIEDLGSQDLRTERVQMVAGYMWESLYPERTTDDTKIDTKPFIQAFVNLKQQLAAIDSLEDWAATPGPKTIN